MFVFEKIMLSTGNHMNDWVNPLFIYLQKRNAFKTSDPNLGQSDVVFDDVTYLSIYPMIHFC